MCRRARTSRLEIILKNCRAIKNESFGKQLSFVYWYVYGFMVWLFCCSLTYTLAWVIYYLYELCAMPRDFCCNGFWSIFVWNCLYEMVNANVSAFPEHHTRNRYLFVSHCRNLYSCCFIRWKYTPWHIVPFATAFTICTIASADNSHWNWYNAKNASIRSLFVIVHGPVKTHFKWQ